eukprot:40010-Prorocentrum_minimum.AAC.1
MRTLYGCASCYCIDVLHAIVIGPGFESASTQTNLYGVKAYWSSKTAAGVATESYAVAVGDSGIVIVSTNRGANWVQKPTCTANTLYDVHFTVGVTTTAVNAFSADVLGAQRLELNRSPTCLVSNRSQQITQRASFVSALNSFVPLPGYQTLFATHGAPGIPEYRLQLASQSEVGAEAPERLHLTKRPLPVGISPCLATILFVALSVSCVSFQQEDPAGDGTLATGVPATERSSVLPRVDPKELSVNVDRVLRTEYVRRVAPWSRVTHVVRHAL